MKGVTVSIEVFSAEAKESKPEEGKKTNGSSKSNAKSSDRSVIMLRRLGGPWMEFRQVFHFFKNSVR